MDGKVTFLGSTVILTGIQPVHGSRGVNIFEKRVWNAPLRMNTVVSTISGFGSTRLAGL